MVYKVGDFLGFDTEIDDDRFSRLENEVYIESSGKLSIQAKGTKDTPHYRECEFCHGDGFIDSDVCFNCQGEGDTAGLFIINTEKGGTEGSLNDDDLVYYTDDDLEVIDEENEGEENEYL